MMPWCVKRLEDI